MSFRRHPVHRGRDKPEIRRAFAAHAQPVERKCLRIAMLGNPVNQGYLYAVHLVGRGATDLSGSTTHDEDSRMAGGWSKDGAVQDQIDASIDDAVELARSRMPSGASLTHCEECGAAISEPRRQAMPGVRLCVNCQSEQEKHQTTPTGFNRRGSKDSQLR